MVLKRLLATALGALGLGALAAGTATAQQIPAPDIFDDQITCTQLLPSVMGFNLPSTVPMGGMTSPLDDIIGMGTNLLEAGDTVFDAVADGAAKLAGLGYVIPPGNMNCGAGTTGPTLGTMNIDADSNGSFLDTGDTIAWGDVPKDVADGYSELLTKYTVVYGDPGGTTGGTLRALEAAQKLVDETDTSLEALLEARVRARDDAQEEHNKALAAFNAASGGPIYQAGVTEWMAKAAVTQGIADYNEQVGKTNTARTALNNMQYSEWNVGDEAANFAVTQGNSKYVPLTNTSLVGTVVTVANGMGTLGALTALETYAGGTTTAPVAGMAAMAATGVGTPDAMAATSSNSSASNFTTLGELIVPMSAANLDDPTDGFNEALIPTVSANGAGTNDVVTIRTTVENVRIAAATLKKARDENTNPRFQDLYDEAYRRAMLEQNYYDALWERVQADNTDTRNAQQRLQYVDTNSNGINEASEQTTANLNNASNSNATAANYYVANPVTIASRNAAYSTESDKRMAEETSLRALVAAREMATAGVVSQFTDAQSFYQQLVDRRTALKAAKDKVVADATTPTATQTKEAEDAAKALMDAVDARDNLVGLFEDEDDPAVDLIGELLKGDDVGDDGGALVKAISSNYDTAKAANDKANEVAEDVAGLIGDDGQVGQNTADIKMNSDNIEKLDGRVAMNEAEIWDADGNSRIDANEMRSMTNATNIATNATNIATNAENIMGLRTDVDMNSEDIMTNAGNIMTNSGRITANEGAISSNADAIASNMNSIGQNASAIGRNSEMITGLQDQMEIVRAGVAASMALAGMPAINGRGVSIGVGSYDGESAFAVGFQIQGEMASFKVGVTSAGGETGASAGVGFQF